MSAGASTFLYVCFRQLRNGGEVETLIQRYFYSFQIENGHLEGYGGD